MRHLALPIVFALASVSNVSNASNAQAPAPAVVPPAVVPAERSAAAPAVVEQSTERTAAVILDEPLTVAVLDLKAGPGTEGIAKALTTLVTAEVGAQRGYRAVSRNELRAILSHQADQRLLGCEEAQCLADIGKLAQARRVIAGSIETSRIDGAAADGTAGDATVLSLVLVEDRKSVV